jgi:hypothetical protein
MLRNRGIEMRSRLAAMDFLPLDPARLRDIRTELLLWKPEPHSAEDPFDSLAHVDAHSYIRLHRLGLLALRLNDDSSAAALARELDGLADRPGGHPIGRTLAASLRARLAGRQGRTFEALSELRDAQWGAVASMSPLEPYDRLLFAQLLETEHRDDEALGYYRQIGSRTTYELPLIWSAELGMARIYERRGERALAARYYAAVAERLGGSDEALRSVRSDAAQRAERLGHRP